MNKQEFLQALRDQLCGLPEAEIARSTDYYAEIIADMTDSGMSEERAVESRGRVSEIARSMLG